MKYNSYLLVCLSAVLGLTACTAARNYPIAELNKPSAKIYVDNFYSKFIITDKLRLCINNVIYGLDIEKGYAKVPAGERISLSFSSQVASGTRLSGNAAYHVSHQSRSAISFIPKAGQSYYATYDLYGDSGKLTIYRETDNPPFNVDIEPTLQKSICAR